MRWAGAFATALLRTRTGASPTPERVGRVLARAACTGSPPFAVRAPTERAKIDWKLEPERAALIAGLPAEPKADVLAEAIDTGGAFVTTVRVLSATQGVGRATWRLRCPAARSMMRVMTIVDLINRRSPDGGTGDNRFEVTALWACWCTETQKMDAMA